MIFLIIREDYVFYNGKLQLQFGICSSIQQLGGLWIISILQSTDVQLYFYTDFIWHKNLVQNILNSIQNGEEYKTQYLIV